MRQRIAVKGKKCEKNKGQKHKRNGMRKVKIYKPGYIELMIKLRNWKDIRNNIIIPNGNKVYQRKLINQEVESRNEKDIDIKIVIRRAHIVKKIEFENC